MSEIPEVIIEIIASNPPSILFALGFILLLAGFISDNVGMIDAGWAFVVLGAVLQVLWLIFRRG
jgi:hypothetical protein